jgi:hypothetical protein
VGDSDTSRAEKIDCMGSVLDRILNCPACRAPRPLVELFHLATQRHAAIARAAEEGPDSHRAYPPPELTEPLTQAMEKFLLTDVLAQLEAVLVRGVASIASEAGAARAHVARR